MIDDGAYDMPEPKDDQSPGERLAQRHLSPGVIDASQARRPCDRALWVAQRTSVTGRLLARYRSFDASVAHSGSLTFFGGRKAHHDEHDGPVTVTTGSYSGALQPGAAVPINAGPDLNGGARSVETAPVMGEHASRTGSASQPVATELQRRLVSRKESAGLVPVRQVQRLCERSVTGAAQRHGRLDRLQSRAREDNARSGAHGDASGEGGAVPVVRGITPEIRQTMHSEQISPTAMEHIIAPSSASSRDTAGGPVITMTDRMVARTRSVDHDMLAGAPATGSARKSMGESVQADGIGGPTSAEPGMREISGGLQTQEAKSRPCAAAELPRLTGTAAKDAGQVFRLSRKKSSPDQAGADIQRSSFLPDQKAQGFEVQGDTYSAAASSQQERRNEAPLVADHGIAVQPETLSRGVQDALTKQETAGGKSGPAAADTQSSAGGSGEGGSRLLLRKYGQYREVPCAEIKKEDLGQTVVTEGSRNPGQAAASRPHVPQPEAAPIAHELRSYRGGEASSSVHVSQALSPAADAAAGPLILRKTESAVSTHSDPHGADQRSSAPERDVAVSPSVSQNKSDDSNAPGVTAIAVKEAQPALAAPGSFAPLGKISGTEALILRKPESNVSKRSVLQENDHNSAAHERNAGGVPSVSQKKSVAVGEQSKIAISAGEVQPALGVAGAIGPLSKGAAAGPLILRKPERNVSKSSGHHEVVREGFESGRVGTGIFQERGPFARSGADAGEKGRISAEPGPESASVHSIHRESTTPFLLRPYRGDAPSQEAGRAALHGPGAGGLQSASEISARSVRQDRPAMVWRTSNQQTAAGPSAAIFRSTGAAATGAAAAGQGGTAAGAETVSPAESPQATGDGTTGAASMDFEEIAEQVSRLLCRRLETERERRGGGW